MWQSFSHRHAVRPTRRVAPRRSGAALATVRTRVASRAQANRRHHPTKSSASHQSGEVVLFMLIVDAVIGFVGFRASLEYVPASVLAWTGRSALDPDLRMYVGIAGAVFGLLYSISVRWPV